MNRIHRWAACWVVAATSLPVFHSADAFWGGCSDPCSGGCAGSPAMLSSGCGGAVGCGQGYVASSGLPGGGMACGGMTSYAAPASSFGGSVITSGATLGTTSMGETLCDPITTYRLVMKPTYVTESRAVTVTESVPETRFRTKTIYKTVPITEEKYRTTVVNVPKTDSKTIEYTVLVAVKEERTVDLVETIPQWNEVPEEFTVRVPKLVDVPEQYTVKVPKLQDESFTYTVSVPYPVTTQKTRTVVNAVPVTKTRSITVSVPQTEMQTVTKDYGHFEERVEEIAVPVASAMVSTGGCGSGIASGGCGSACGTPCGGCRTSCGGCRSGCGQVTYAAGCGGPCGGAMTASVSMTAPAMATTMVTRRVWVPNVVTETVPVTTSVEETREIAYTVFEQEATQVPYECTTIAYRPETRTGTKKAVVYVDETRTRSRKQVQYNDETRTRMRKELTYTTVNKTETVPYVSYKTETRTKEVSYSYTVPEYKLEPYTATRYEQVAEEVVEEYTISVTTPVTKEQQVQVCKMVPTLVEETVQLCTESTASVFIQSPMIEVGPSVLDGGGPGCGIGPTYIPTMPSMSPATGCGGCGSTVSASPCHGC